MRDFIAARPPMAENDFDANSSNEGEKTIVPYIEPADDIVYNQEVSSSSVVPTLDLVLSDAPSQNQVALWQLGLAKPEGIIFQRNPGRGIIGGGRSDTSSIRSCQSSRSPLTQPVPGRPTAMSILRKLPSLYRQLEVCEDMAELMSQIWDIINLISLRRKTVLPDRSIMLAALTTTHQMLCRNLYETRKKLEGDEEALVDYAKINRRIVRLRNPAGGICHDQKINIKSPLAEEYEKGLGRDNMLL